jgi:FMN phosphatase YigB (HAD superfamily)
MIHTLRNTRDFLEPHRVKFLFFDKGGTLSKPVIPGPDNGREENVRMMRILQAQGDPDDFGREISRRDKAYKKWALDSWIELSEEERCTRFLFHDYPDELVRAHAEELTLLFSHSKGERVLRPEALPVIQELHGRGYKMGVISNTVSRVLVPGELEEAGLTPYISTLVMSSLTGVRKPDPAIFTQAAREAETDPWFCAYVGDQPDRDVEGPRRAGFGLNVVLKTSNYPEGRELPELQRPDITIDLLEELLELFP